ncbi:MAG: D-TA family PLP-dependent enzyme [Acidobacteriaceae bacterium]|nr:D-TA family PLP-dependent enzyme [Acidobacteriaceae bacterium]
MLPPLAAYQVEDAEDLLTPALLIYPELVESNISATLKMTGNDPSRWRPHIKTAKIPALVELMISRGVQQFKCSTTLELLVACQAGASDVLLAYPVMGANAARTKEIAAQFPRTAVSVLVETAEQAALWEGSKIGVFIDLRTGMNRTGIDPDRLTDISHLARDLGQQFRGVHFYDGHIAGGLANEREARAHEGYDRLLQLVRSLTSQGVPVAEVITSGTPASPFAILYAGFRNADFVHRISPGTVVYNDIVSLEQLPEWGYQPAAVVLTTVVSHPKPGITTCDAGHKSVSADAGVPTCAVVGHPDWKPAKPSEEHLPIELPENEAPRLGDKLYLVPRHVCPTVNNFDEAVFVVRSRIQRAEPVGARGHESALKMAIVSA